MWTSERERAIQTCMTKQICLHVRTLFRPGFFFYSVFLIGKRARVEHSHHSCFCYKCCWFVRRQILRIFITLTFFPWFFFRFSVWLMVSAKPFHVLRFVDFFFCWLWFRTPYLVIWIMHWTLFTMHIFSCLQHYSLVCLGIWHFCALLHCVTPHFLSAVTIINCRHTIIALLLWLWKLSQSLFQQVTSSFFFSVLINRDWWFLYERKKHYVLFPAVIFFFLVSFIGNSRDCSVFLPDLKA